MSLSKKKYLFLRRKTEIKENSYNTEIYLENINNNNKNNQTAINPEISLNDLIHQTNYSERLSKELINSNPLTESEIRNEITDIKNEENELDNNSKLLYLIHQNKSENIDFINTLLKLKGIQIYSNNSDKSLNNIISQNYEDRNNSTLISKAKTISENYPRNDNEEEFLKKINNSIYSINDNNYNLDNTNKTFNKYSNTYINMMKIEPNIFQNERMTKDFEKENNNFFLYHTNKDTISSIECNTNNSTKKNIRKNEIELINTRECCLNITIPENNNKVLRRRLIPINKDKNYKTSYESNRSRKNIINYSKEKSINKKKSIKDVFKGKKIFNEKSNKRMHPIRKYNFEINNPSLNNSKERQLKNHYSQINEINLKISENSKKYYNKKNNIRKNIISLNKKMSNNRNISFIKKNNKKNIINKSTNYLFNKNNKIFNENHYKSNINEYNSEKTKIFEKKIKKEKIKQILMKEILNNPKQIKKSNTKKIINKNLNKNNNMPNDTLPSYTDRKKKSKIFKIRNAYNDKLKKLLNKNNNFSSYINPKNKDNKFISKNLTLSNVNSYKKISKPKNHFTPLFKTKNKNFPIRTNLFNESIFKYNKFNISCNNTNMSINSMKNKNFGLNAINKKKKIFNKMSKNKNKANIIMKDKNKLRLMIDLKGEKNSNLKEKFKDDDKIITNKEIDNNEIQEIKIKNLNTNEFCQNNSIYKKENNVKRAEIFLFDNNEQIQNNNNEENKNNSKNF